MNNVEDFMCTTIIPGCKMGERLTRLDHDAGYIKVEKDWVAASGGALDVYSCDHADVFSCTTYDNLSEQMEQGQHIVTLCEPCFRKADTGAIVVDAESLCTLNIFGIYEPG